MRSHFLPGLFVASFLAASAATASAFVAFNDGHDQFFVTGTAGITYDSNIYAYNDGAGDTSYNASVDLEYHRRAGMLGVNGNLGWNFSKFDEFSSEDFANPHFFAELTKDAGRTTGSVTATAKRENRAETSLNMRTTSWDYGAGVNVKYPVIERYSLTGQAAWDRRDYLDNLSLVDLDTVSLNTDLLYAYNSQRDLFGGYRLRVTETSANTRDTDHALTIGTTGKLLPTVTGTARVGYQLRESTRENGSSEHYDDITGSVSATWNVLSRLTVTGALNSDFDTIATDVSVSTVSGSIRAQYALNSRFSVNGGTGTGHVRYLGAAGGGRRDTYFMWDAGLAYTFNDHLKANLSYTYLENWSTFAYSDYTRSTISLNLSSRW